MKKLLSIVFLFVAMGHAGPTPQELKRLAGVSIYFFDDITLLKGKTSQDVRRGVTLLCPKHTARIQECPDCPDKFYTVIKACPEAKSYMTLEKCAEKRTMVCEFK